MTPFAGLLGSTPRGRRAVSTLYRDRMAAGRGALGRARGRDRGRRAVLAHAFDVLQLDEIVSITTVETPASSSHGEARMSPLRARQSIALPEGHPLGSPRALSIRRQAPTTASNPRR